MLEYFCIFSKGGALLWTWQLTALRGSPIEALIRTCLLEERTGDKNFTYKPTVGAAYTLKWTLENSFGLVFVAVYQSALKLLYVEKLLDRVKIAFTAQYSPKKFDYDTFEVSFKRELEKAEQYSVARSNVIQSGTGNICSRKDGRRSTGQSNGNLSSQQNSSEESEDGETDASNKDTSAEDLTVMTQSNGQIQVGNENEKGEGGEEDRPKVDVFDVNKIKGKLAKRGPRGAHAKVEKPKKEKSEAQKSKKVARKWNGTGDKEDGVLDYSAQPADSDLEALAADMSKASLVDEAYNSGEDSGTEDEAVGGQKKTGLLSAFVSSIGVKVVGKAALSREDVAPALDQLKRKLMEKNVAHEIAAKLCESVAANLVGKRLESFTRVSSLVRAAVEEALTRILTPRRSIDILREIQAAKAKGKPYRIVFVGVNGVGKSTNLSKVAYWLLQHNISVMIAACDTFRSGAVEQLKTHCNRLSIPLYERGYEKDPAKVAYEASLQAARTKTDVLLVDTAGRMQDNEPLMRALSNLITLNEPELVLFVGEALVGNDAVDQLTKFNQRLLDLSTTAKAHAIDGILITKFDTIDDKVGAALSMVYTSGAPVMFVGCGQTYVDLKRLNVKSVVRSLLS